MTELTQNISNKTSDYNKYSTLFTNELKKLIDILEKKTLLQHEKNYCIIRTGIMLEEAIKKITVLIYKDYAITLNNSNVLELKVSYDDFKKLQNSQIDFEELYFENLSYILNPYNFQSKFEKLFKIKIFNVIKSCSKNDLDYYKIIKSLHQERNKMAHDLSDTDWTTNQIHEMILIIEKFFNDYMNLLHAYFTLATDNDEFITCLDKSTDHLNYNEFQKNDKKIIELLKKQF